MMKAFKIRWSDTTRSMAIGVDYRYQLPQVECLDCEPKYRSWGDEMFEFPALQFDFLNEKEFTFDRVLNLDQFGRLKARIEAAAGRPVNLIPGCCIGEVAGEAFVKNLDDILWGRITYPQISARGCDLLAEEGIVLTTAKCSIHYRRKKIDSHLAVQIEPVALLTEECRESLGITRCLRCGNFILPTPPLKIRRSGGGGPRRPKRYHIRRSAWPKGQHLVTIQETHEVLASQEFIEAVKKLNLKDIAFIECGRYV